MVSMVERLLLLLAGLIIMIGIGNVTGEVACNVTDLEVDTNLTLNVNCSRFDPTYNYIIDEAFQYAGTNNFNRYTVQYTCRTNSSLINTTDGLLEINPTFTWPIWDPTVIAPTDTRLITTLSYAFTTGDECTFSGCYYTVEASATAMPIARAIQPTSCVIDLDECTSGANDCDEHAECINTVGSFQCHCTAGYTGDGKNCQNINECSEGTDNCSENAVCRDTDGSYDCSCFSGYENEEDEFKCTDIDECTLDIHNCSETATCTNTDGSYNCSCNPGYEGDGFNCSETPCDCGENADCVPNGESFICACKGVESENSTNDCLRLCGDSGDLVCDGRSECRETNGIFACQCSVGYEESGSGCIDINECVEGTHDCSPHASCIDSNGSYSCRCNAGYDGNGVNCRIGAVVWVFGVGASTVLVLAVALTVLVCCIIRRRRNGKEDIYEVFFKWKDVELNPDFAPVSFEVSSMKLSPSLISTFDTLEKFSNEEPLECVTPNGSNENINSSSENVSPVERNTTGRKELELEMQDGILHSQVTPFIPCKPDIQAVLTNTPAEEVSSTSTHNPTMCTANREDDRLLGNLHKSGQAKLLPTHAMEHSLPTAHEHANGCTIQESSCDVPDSSSTEHNLTIMTRTDFQSIDVLMLESDNAFIDTSDTETLEVNDPCNLTDSSTRSRVADSCSSVSSGYMSYSLSPKGSDDSDVQASNHFIKGSNGYLQSINAKRSESESGYISTAEAFHF